MPALLSSADRVVSKIIFLPQWCTHPRGKERENKKNIHSIMPVKKSLGKNKTVKRVEKDGVR